jgi:hypothetical protein
MDDRSYFLLEDIARRESRSLLQYVRDAYPWITPDEREVLNQIRAMIDEELQGVVELVRFLYSLHRPPPYFGSYPTSFTGLSFVSLDHLLPLLATNEAKELERLEREVVTLIDPEAKALVEKIIANKRRHLETLQRLAAAHSQTAVA